MIATLYYMFSWIMGLGYLAFLAITYTGLVRMKRSRFLKDDDPLPTVTVVVAARDEETRIGRLLDSLEAQDYPRDKFDVIVVDDRSRDNTSDLVKQRHSHVKYSILRIRDGETPSGRSPKKYALGQGIKKATGEIIVTTDADCWMGKSWLRAIVSPFTDPKVAGATGVSRFVRPNGKPTPWWSDLESLEHLSYSVGAAGTIGMGHVTNAHGSNLAARRIVYERIGGYTSTANVTSGDDVFLLQDVAKNGGKVVFVDRPEGYVFSQPVDTLREWVNQRARWSSKSGYYPPFLLALMVGMGGCILSSNLGIALAMMGKIPFRIPVFMNALKIFLESIVMKRGCDRFGESISYPKFVITQLVHPPAISYAVLRGQFFSFTWKGQRYRGASKVLNTPQNGNSKS